MSAPPNNKKAPGCTSAEKLTESQAETNLEGASSQGQAIHFLTFDQIASLPIIEYEMVRKTWAKAKNIRVSVLDDQVHLFRALRFDKSNAPAATPLVIPAVEPWPEPTNGAELLGEILATLKRFVIADDHYLETCALFSLFTYSFDLGDVCPILLITSPTKRCGKTRLFSMMARLANRPLTASSASAPALYRTIQLHHPTILIDEVDAFMKEDERMRGLVNSGHTRDAAYHLGCGSKDADFLPQRWSTWTPKVFSGIGSLADTIEDRAFIISMRRKKKGETVERLRERVRFEDIRRKCARFVADNTEAIRNADPSIPPSLNDRAADNWAPLLTLADLAGGEWPQRARAAALRMADGGEIQDTGAKLLADIEIIFEQDKVDRFASTDLCDRLAEHEPDSWGRYGRTGKPISQCQLANLLRGFQIAPDSIRFDAGTLKGYHKAQFSDAITRYLPTDTPQDRNTGTSPANVGLDEALQGGTPDSRSSLETVNTANNSGLCSSVPPSGLETSGDVKP